MDAFQIDPTSNWDSDVGLELRKHLLDLDIDQDLGWVNIEDLALVSKTLAGEPFIPPVDDAEESNPMLLPGIQVVCRGRTFGDCIAELHQLDFTLDILFAI